MYRRTAKSAKKYSSVRENYKYSDSTTHLGLLRLLASALTKRCRKVRALLADMLVPFTAARVVQSYPLIPLNQ